MDNDLTELQRNIGRPVIEPTKFSIGCLSVLDCGSGYLKVSLRENELEPLAELLPPQETKTIIKWLQDKFK
jgi:hypothetical protein